MILLSYFRFVTLFLLGSVFLLITKPCFADLTLNLGYHNPPGAKVGVNFLYWSNPWMFEIGIGWIDVNSLDNDEDNNGANQSANDEADDDLRVAIAGATNVKYGLSSGVIHPYLQLGVGAGTLVQVGDNSDIGAGIGRLYGGLGLMLGSPQFYAYGSINAHANSKNSFVQLGVGFNI